MPDVPDTPVDLKPRSREVTDGPQKAPARAMLRAVGDLAAPRLQVDWGVGDVFTHGAEATPGAPRASQRFAGLMTGCARGRPRRSGTGPFQAEELITI